MIFCITNNKDNIKKMSINITTKRDVIKIIKYSGVSLNRINRVNEENILLFIIVKHYFDCYFINGLRVVNVYFTRLLLHIDYDGAKCELRAMK